MPHDDQAELFFWVDENDQELGTITRAEAHSGTRKIHRSVYVLLINKDQQLAMQMRSKHKDTYPGYWTISSSGHVTKPQTYQETAIRELEEEIGYRSNQLEFAGSVFYDDPREREISHIFIAKFDGIQSLIADPFEVEKISWIDISDLNNWVSQNPLSPGALQVLSYLKMI